MFDYRIYNGTFPIFFDLSLFYYFCRKIERVGQIETDIHSDWDPDLTHPSFFIGSFDYNKKLVFVEGGFDLNYP